MGSGILTLTVTVAASAAVNTIQLVNIGTSPEVATVTTLVIPQTQTWIITDVYILTAGAAGTSDPQLRFVKNQVNTVGQIAPLSALLVTANSRPQLNPKLGFEGNSQLQIYSITTVVNDATADSITAYAPVDKRF